MGLTLIEAAKYENCLEQLAVLNTFSEGELLALVPAGRWDEPAPNPNRV